MYIFDYILNLFYIFNGKKKLLIFESKKQYFEIFNEIETILKKNQIKFKSIIINTTKDKNLPGHVLYLDSSTTFALLKYCNKYDVLTSTPTINKKINPNCNFFFFQHSLMLNTDTNHKKYMSFFDRVYACSLDQFEYLEKSIGRKKIYKYKFYHLNKFFISVDAHNVNTEAIKTILIAPSFGSESIIHGLNLVKLQKLSQNYKVIFRFHPESLKIKSDIEAINQIKHSLKGKNITISSNASNIEDINNSDYLLTENSGIALTFTYIKNTPPIFIKYSLNADVTKSKNFSKKFLNEIALFSSITIEDIEEKIKLINENKVLKEKIINFKNEQFMNFSNDNSLNLKI